MQFLAPIFLAAAIAGATIPLIIHLLNRERADRLIFGTIRFIKAATQTNVQRHRLKQIILLIMRIVILALLGIAFARPFFADRLTPETAIGGSENRIVIFDNSFSMTQMLNRSKQIAKKSIESADTIAVISASDHAKILKSLDENRDLAQLAIDQISPSERPTDLIKAIQTANEILRDIQIGNKKLTVVTDMQKIAWQNFVETDRLSPGVEIELISPDQQISENLAITEIRLPKTIVNQQKRNELIARVKNFGVRSAKTQMRFFIGGDQIEKKEIEISANDITDVKFYIPIRDDGVQVGFVEIDDNSIAIDNRRFFQIDLRPSISVLCVNGEPSDQNRFDEIFFFKNAIEVSQKITAIDLTVSKNLINDLKKFDAVILANAAKISATEAEKLIDFVKSGGGLFISCGDRIEIDNYNEMIGEILPCVFSSAIGDAIGKSSPRLIANLDYDHPIFEIFKEPNHGDFGTVRIYRNYQIAATENAIAIASLDDGAPVMIEKIIENGRVMVFTSTIDREWTDLPIHPVYVPFLHAVIKHLTLTPNDETPNYLVGDDILISDLEPSIEVAVFDPNGDETRLTTNENGSLFLRSIERSGIYTIQISGGKNYYFVINVDTVESDLSKRDLDEITDMLINPDQIVTEITEKIITKYRKETEKDQSLWWYLLCGMFLVAIGEMFLANRIN